MSLIDKKELKEWVENWFYQNKYYHPYSKSNNIPCSELYDILERMPTVDAVPVVHGEWEHKPNTYICECTACLKYWIPDGDEYEYHYCPNCGAKMKGESNGNAV